MQEESNYLTLTDGLPSVGRTLQLFHNVEPVHNLKYIDDVGDVVELMFIIREIEKRGLIDNTHLLFIADNVYMDTFTWGECGKMGRDDDIVFRLRGSKFPRLIDKNAELPIISHLSKQSF